MNAENECIQAELERYLDDDLGRDERSSTEQHLNDCPACQHQLAALRLSADLLREHLEEASAVADFAGFEDRVLSAVGSQTSLGLAERAGLWVRESLTYHKPAWVVSSAGLALLVLALALLPLLRGEPTAPPIAPGPDPAPQLAQVDNETIIDSMEYAGERSMIFTTSKNNTTVIWMYDFDGPGALDGQGDEI